ncbi:MAG: ABC transporter ATP-binding protein [Nitrospinae bacterium]|nr:ABC transporter ATP-binding protein [Nitrospinota bacterium]
MERRRGRGDDRHAVCPRLRTGRADIQRHAFAGPQRIVHNRPGASHDNERYGQRGRLGPISACGEDRLVTDLIPAALTQDLRFTYPDGALALDGVSLRVDDGQKVGLVGANGAGKSTLLLHLNGVLTGEGSVSVFGIPVIKRNLKEVRKRVGLVFQNPDDQLFMPTLLDDVAFGPRNMGLSENDAVAKAMDALNRLGLPQLSNRNGYHLSAGQKKRAAIATVLSMGVPLLALDEPTGGLDPKNRRELIATLKTIGGAQIIATHDFGLVRELCGRVVIMSDGKIVAEGAPDALLCDEELLKTHGLA